VFDQEGRRIVPGHPDYDDVREALDRLSEPAPNPNRERERAMLDIKPALRKSFDAVMDEIDPYDFAARTRAEVTLDRILHGERSANFEHIAKAWEPYTYRERRLNLPASVVAAFAVPDFGRLPADVFAASMRAQTAERRPSGILVPIRAPRRETPTQWLARAADALARHCQDQGHDPFDCDYRCLAAAMNRAPVTVARAASRKDVGLARIQGEAWKLLGCPNLTNPRNFVYSDTH